MEGVERRRKSRGRSSRAPEGGPGAGVGLSARGPPRAEGRPWEISLETLEKGLSGTVFGSLREGLSPEVGDVDISLRYGDPKTKGLTEEESSLLGGLGFKIEREGGEARISGTRQDEQEARQALERRSFEGLREKAELLYVGALEAAEMRGRAPPRRNRENWEVLAVKACFAVEGLLFSKALLRRSCGATLDVLYDTPGVRGSELVESLTEVEREVVRHLQGWYYGIAGPRRRVVPAMWGSWIRGLEGTRGNWLASPGVRPETEEVSRVLSASFLSLMLGLPGEPGPGVNGYSDDIAREHVRECCVAFAEFYEVEEGRWSTRSPPPRAPAGRGSPAGIRSGYRPSRAARDFGVPD